MSAVTASSIDILEDFVRKQTQNQGDQTATRRQGMFESIRVRLFGDHLKDVKVKSHSQFFSFLGTLISPLLMALFSVSAVLVLEKNTLNDPLLFHHWLSVLKITTTLLFVLAMDVCLFLAVTWIKDIVTQRKKSYVAIAVLGAFAFAIGLVEGLTFFSLITGTDITGFLNPMRSILIPTCVVFLIARPKHVLSREDVDNLILGKTAAALVRSLEDLVISGSSSFGDLLELFVNLTIPDDANAAARQIAKDKELITLIGKMRPPDLLKIVTQYIQGEKQEHMTQIDELTRGLNKQKQLMTQKVAEMEEQHEQDRRRFEQRIAELESKNTRLAEKNDQLKTKDVGPATGSQKKLSADGSDKMSTEEMVAVTVGMLRDGSKLSVRLVRDQFQISQSTAQTVLKSARIQVYGNDDSNDDEGVA